MPILSKNSVTSPTIENWTYRETEKTPSGSTATFGTVYYEYSDTEAGEFTKNVPKNAGIWYVCGAVEGTNNYAAAFSAPVSFKINKADLTLSVNIEEWKYGEKAKSPSINGNLENGKVTYTYKEKDAEDNTYSETVPTNAGSYTVKATVAERTAITATKIRALLKSIKNAITIAPATINGERKNKRRNMFTPF